MGHTTFDATITHHDTDPRYAELGDVLRLMTEDDAKAFAGDMLRYSSRLEWKLAVSNLPVERTELVRDWYDHARRDDHEWSIHFPVTLIGRGLVPTVMHGGMVVRLDCRKDAVPAYRGMSVHT